jgi:hypothetical protein
MLAGRWHHAAYEMKGFGTSPDSSIIRYLSLRMLWKGCLWAGDDRHVPKLMDEMRMLADGGSLRVTRTRRPRRSRSVTLDTALTAGGLEAAAEPVDLTGRYERTHHGAIIDAFRAKIGALNDRGPAAELPGELRL